MIHPQGACGRLFLSDIGKRNSVENNVGKNLHFLVDLSIGNSMSRSICSDTAFYKIHISAKIPGKNLDIILLI